MHICSSCHWGVEITFKGDTHTVAIRAPTLNVDAYKLNSISECRIRIIVFAVPIEFVRVHSCDSFVLEIVVAQSF